MSHVIWDRFCSDFNVAETCVPLFATDRDGNVLHRLIGKNQRPVLMRSPEMDELILSTTDRLIEDWEQRTHRYDGMIYLMGWKQSGRFVPLYVGKTETFGLTENLSANIRNLHRDRSKFARWGDNYAYHIGDLSACVLPGHPEHKKLTKYREWAQCLFEDGTRLRQPVYFWACAWDPSYSGLWEEFGPTSLAALEYLLIAVAHNISPRLLNREGRPRNIRSTVAAVVPS